ncbi:MULTISPECIES: asparaginase [Paenibacillus]|uniref:L-asparaginase II n=1 Tax=Paenibacillus sabinae T27 TaxID=1268072 RepID=X5A5G2_9BACL|nr:MULTISPECIES: asparaginase [Paenibacillus]AHV99049.1 L-asparaginase II [Paenibacillus sabinae T27]NJJ42253.1 asparaginase [Paenibacillus apii]
METVLVKEYRANLMECAHSGHIAMVGENGVLKGYSGDPGFVSFTRSSAKPLQAIPGIRGGIAGKYGLSAAEVALMTASHRGEDYHLQALESISAKTGITESCMICASSYPLDEGSREEAIRSVGKRKLYHNCSGKHLGLLSYSKSKALPLESYAQPDHPVQQEVLRTVAYMAGLSPKDISLGTDGCGLPVFALPLTALAHAYLKLSCPELIEDIATREAVKQITSSMHAHPEMVAGYGRLDSLLLEDDNIVAKGGFKGVYCFGLRSERLGFAFKILDGSEEEWGLIVRSILEQIGYSNRATISKLEAAFPNEIVNDEGMHVGRAETVFKLELI